MYVYSSRYLKHKYGENIGKISLYLYVLLNSILEYTFKNHFHAKKSSLNSEHLITVQFW